MTNVVSEPALPAPPGNGWRPTTDMSPPAHVVLQVRLGDGNVAYACWEPERGLWSTIPAPILPADVVAWRPAPRVR